MKRVLIAIEEGPPHRGCGEGSIAVPHFAGPELAHRIVIVLVGKIRKKARQRLAARLVMQLPNGTA